MLNQQTIDQLRAMRSKMNLASSTINNIIAADGLETKREFQEEQRIRLCEYMHDILDIMQDVAGMDLTTVDVTFIDVTPKQLAHA